MNIPGLDIANIWLLTFFNVLFICFFKNIYVLLLANFIFQTLNSIAFVFIFFTKLTLHLFSCSLPN